MSRRVEGWALMLLSKQHVGCAAGWGALPGPPRSGRSRRPALYSRPRSVSQAGVPPVLLSPPPRVACSPPGACSYAATCQTVGMNLGYFSSFTVFLALNDASFANKYLPGLSSAGEGAQCVACVCPSPGEGAQCIACVCPPRERVRGWLAAKARSWFAVEGVAECLPVRHVCALGCRSAGAISLSGYLRFWGWAYLAITVAVALFTREPSAGSSGAPPANGTAAAAASNGAAIANGHKAGNGAATLRRSARVAAAPPGKPAPPANDHHQQRQQPAASDTSGSSCSSIGGADQEEVLPLREAYLQLWRVVRLPVVQASWQWHTHWLGVGPAVHTLPLLSRPVRVAVPPASAFPSSPTPLPPCSPVPHPPPSPQLLALVLVTARLGMLTAEAAAPLKLLEKGVSKEALAGLVLAEFPMELLSALVAGRWAAASHPFDPWLTGYRTRLVLAALR